MCPIDTTSPLISYSARYRPARSRRRPGDPYGNDPARARIIGQPVNGVQHRAEPAGSSARNPAAWLIAFSS